MSLPTFARAIRKGRPLAVSAVVLMLAVAACSGATAPTPTPTVAVPTTASTAPPAASPRLAPSASPAPVATPTPTLPALTLLWQKGGPTPSQPETWQPAVDPVTGDIWVAASFDNVFWIFSPDGKYLESWGTPGKGNGQLALSTRDQNPTPRGSIVFTADGSFYVVDAGNNRVQEFDKSRKYVMQFGGFGHTDGKFTRPLQVATDGKTIYVSDDDQMTLQAFDMNGHWLRTLPWSAYGGFTLDRAGRIVTQTGGNVAPADLAVFVLDPRTGQQVAKYPVPPLGQLALGIAVDGAGDIFMNIALDDEHAPDITVGLVELDKAGRVIGTWSTAGETIAVSPDGRAIYLASDWTFIRKYALPTP